MMLGLNSQTWNYRVAIPNSPMFHHKKYPSLHIIQESNTWDSDKNKVTSTKYYAVIQLFEFITQNLFVSKRHPILVWKAIGTSYSLVINIYTNKIILQFCYIKIIIHSNSSRQTKWNLDPSFIAAPTKNRELVLVGQEI